MTKQETEVVRKSIELLDMQGINSKKIVKELLEGIQCINYTKTEN